MSADGGGVRGRMFVNASIDIVLSKGGILPAEPSLTGQINFVPIFGKPRLKFFIHSKKIHFQMNL